MGSRCIIGRVEPDGTGEALYCHKGASPHRNGLTLINHYQEPETVSRLTAIGAISSLDPDVATTEKFHPEEFRRAPMAFENGTDGFFSTFWGHGPEWLYCWTPDGWLAAPGIRGPAPEQWYQGEENPNDPEWAKWLETTAKFQRPMSLGSAIEETLQTGE